MIGQTVLHYRVVSKLGRGGMGVVYEAEDLRLHRRVALKFLPEDSASLDSSTLQRFRREAEAASALNHPFICTIYDVGEHEGRPFIVMEKLEGESLSHLLNGKPLPVERILEIGSHIAEALAAAHAIGIIHRDIKPANLFVTSRGDAKLLDFGLARIDREVSSPAVSGADSSTQIQVDELTRAGTTLGTIAYMSPEQARAEPLDGRSDIFSLGAVLYEMATGRSPFPRGSAAATFDAILNRPVIPPSELNAAIPHELDQLILSALEKQRDLRLQSAKELRAALLRLRRDTSGSSVPTEARAMEARRSRLLAPGAIIAAAIVIAAGGWLLSGRMERTSSEQMALTPAGSLALAKNETVADDITRVAVLPLVTLGASEDEYLGEGLTEELITALGRVEGLRVTARTSSFALKGKGLATDEIARRLGVIYLVEGSIRRDGNRLRVNAQLVHAFEGYELWSERYDGDPSDVFAFQTEIARSIVAALRPRLAPQRVARQPDFAAYDLYLRGRHAWTRRTPEGLKLAADYFQQAISRDPDFAQAHAGLADALSLMGAYRYADGERRKDALMAIDQALALDDGLAEAHASRGRILIEEHRTDTAELSLRRTIELNPSYASAYHWLGALLTYVGRFEEAIESLRRTIDLDPLSPPARSQYGFTLTLAGRNEEALVQVLRANQLAPEFFGPLAVMSRIQTTRGNHEEAIASAERAVALVPDNPIALAFLARAHALAGDRQSARELLRRIEAQSDRCAACIAEVRAASGDFSGALDALESPSWKASSFFYPQFDSIYRSLHGQPRFHAFLRRAGLEHSLTRGASAAPPPAAR
jgi:TolB-like protein/Tfp pilus assembly protein PilF/predicted Ser/Thr protein kinase